MVAKGFIISTWRKVRREELFFFSFSYKQDGAEFHEDNRAFPMMKWKVVTKLSLRSGTGRQGATGHQQLEFRAGQGRGTHSLAKNVTVALFWFFSFSKKCILKYSVCIELFMFRVCF